MHFNRNINRKLSNLISKEMDNFYLSFVIIYGNLLKYTAGTAQFNLRYLLKHFSIVIKAFVTNLTGVTLCYDYILN